MTTLFEKIGGAEAVDAAVEKFYHRVLADDRIKHFFADVDMVVQRKHQKRFLTFAFGGTPCYEGRSMRDAHKTLVSESGLSDKHFDAVLENLTGTLEDLGISEELIQEVGGVAESTRMDILNR